MTKEKAKELLKKESSRASKYANAVATNSVLNRSGLYIISKPSLKEHIVATVVDTLPNGIKRFCYLDDEGTIISWIYGNEFEVYGELVEL